jgi:hypothetical protein
MDDSGALSSTPLLPFQPHRFNAPAGLSTTKVGVIGRASGYSDLEPVLPPLNQWRWLTLGVAAGGEKKARRHRPAGRIASTGAQLTQGDRLLALMKKAIRSRRRLRSPLAPPSPIP